MSALIVIIMESETTSRAVAETLDATLGNLIETTHMTYHNSLLSRTLMLHTHLFILDLFSNDKQGRRAEGIFVAESFAKANYCSLVISSLACADRINSPYYWDFAATDYLPNRVHALLMNQVQMPADAYTPLKKAFPSQYRPPHDGHHH